MEMFLVKFKFLPHNLLDILNILGLPLNILQNYCRITKYVSILIYVYVRPSFLPCPPPPPKENAFNF